MCFYTRPQVQIILLILNLDPFFCFYIDFIRSQHRILDKVFIDPLKPLNSSEANDYLLIFSFLKSKKKEKSLCAVASLISVSIRNLPFPFHLSAVMSHVTKLFPQRSSSLRRPSFILHFSSALGDVSSLSSSSTITKLDYSYYSVWLYHVVLSTIVMLFSFIAKKEKEICIII